MSYQVLARKWRPKQFTEMVGQGHVLKALVNALDDDRLHHAYLFTGTRGVGKTSIARLFAKALNCEQGISSTPCGECGACIEIAEGRFVDLIEVDAASRTKVEDTRELLENVQYAPSRGRFKVYLIDEVHMLSKSSFNALLKTLEEPPPHVKFLLATTDPQKLPVTVLSRCLQFNLKNMIPQRIVEHLAMVLNSEKIDYDEEALWLLARSADGSMRDALSLTDQSIAFGGGSISETDVRVMLGSIDLRLVYKILSSLIDGDGLTLLQSVADLAQFSPDYNTVLGDIVSLLHRIAIAQTVPAALDNSLGDKLQVTELAAQLTAEDVQLYYQIALMGRKDLPFVPDAREGLEMTLLRMLAFRPASSKNKSAKPSESSHQLNQQALNDQIPNTQEKPLGTEQIVANSKAEPSVAAHIAQQTGTSLNRSATTESVTPHSEAEPNVATQIAHQTGTALDRSTTIESVTPHSEAGPNVAAQIAQQTATALDRSTTTESVTPHSEAEPNVATQIAHQTGTALDRSAITESVIPHSEAEPSVAAHIAQQTGTALDRSATTESVTPHSEAEPSVAAHIAQQTGTALDRSAPIEVVSRHNEAEFGVGRQADTMPNKTNFISSDTAVQDFDALTVKPSDIIDVDIDLTSHANTVPSLNKTSYLDLSANVTLQTNSQAPKAELKEISLQQFKESTKDAEYLKNTANNQSVTESTVTKNKTLPAFDKQHHAMDIAPWEADDRLPEDVMAAMAAMAASQYPSVGSIHGISPAKSTIEPSMNQINISHLLPQPVITLEHLSVDDWPALVGHIGFTGMTAHIAENLSLERVGKTQIEFNVSKVQKNVLDNKQKERIQTLICQYFKCSVQVSYDSQKSTRETPWQCFEKLRATRLSAAIANFQNNATVQQIMATFSAEVDRSSIMPID